MANNHFSVGRDCQLVVMGPAGRVDLTHVTAFESRQITHSLRVDRLDGTQIAAELPKGWEGSFEVERGNSAVDDFIADLDFANLGFVIVGAFVAAWVVSFAVFKLRRIEERWGALVEQA